MTSKAEIASTKIKGTAKRPKYDLQMLGRLEHVIAPKQARSERSFQRILAALEALLVERPLAEISIPDIASKAKCGVAAIYARFTDKHGVVAALHETLRERWRERINEEYKVERWKDHSVELFIAALTLDLTEFYAGNRNLLAAALLINDGGVHIRVAQAIVQMSERLQTMLSALRGSALSAKEQELVELGIRAMVALLEQRILFHPVNLSSIGTGSNEEFAANLATIFLACLGCVGQSPT